MAYLSRDQRNRLMQTLAPSLHPSPSALATNVAAGLRYAQQRYALTWQNWPTPSPPMSEYTGWEFAVGSVRGVRAFKVDIFGRLMGVTKPYIWTPGENTAACQTRAAPSMGWLNDTVRSVAASPGVDYDPLTDTYTVAGEVAQRGDSVALANGDTLYIDVGGGLIIKPQYGASYAVARPQKPSQSEPEHDMATCTCGFYAVADPAHLMPPSSGDDAPWLVGVIEAWGKVVCGTKGFRANKAKVLAVAGMTGTKGVPSKGRIDGPLLHRVLHNYPHVKGFPGVEAMLREFPSSDLALPTPESDPDFWTRKV